jgi:hypothetical protein
LFNSGGYVALFQDECLQSGFTDLKASTESRFLGLMDGWVGPPSILQALLSPFGGTPGDGAIIDIDRAACTSVVDGAGGGTRLVLSFNATVRFQR